ncbi:hypothetical protein ACEWY4_020397 [Coilia grayii]|uniref:PLAC domain-containing protein n=1 Tax=Coilia grayii TaxID=363190 RepID=A0ABD1JDQ4_9TELE
MRYAPRIKTEAHERVSELDPTAGIIPGRNSVTLRAALHVPKRRWLRSRLHSEEGSELEWKVTGYSSPKPVPSHSFNLPPSISMAVTCHKHCSWSVGSWGACSRTCGEAKQSREVECVQRTAPGQVEKIAASRCPQPTPPSLQSCHNPTCPPQWSTGPWSQCSSVRRCGKGVRRRLVECRSVGVGGRALPERSCDARLRPSSQESCQLRRCSRPSKAQWVLSTWQQHLNVDRVCPLLFSLLLLVIHLHVFLLLLFLLPSTSFSFLSSFPSCLSSSTSTSSSSSSPPSSLSRLPLPPPPLFSPLLSFSSSSSTSSSPCCLSSSSSSSCPVSFTLPILLLFLSSFTSTSSSSTSSTSSPLFLPVLLALLPPSYSPCSLSSSTFSSSSSSSSPSSLSQCSVTCGVGVQKRQLKCAEKDVEGKYQELVAKRCQQAAQPSVELQRACVQSECPRPAHISPSWYTAPWSQCTVSCGGGVQSRSVQCLLSGRPVSGCPAHLKPPMAQACNSHYCPRLEKKAEMVCQDHFNWCYLVPQHGVCHHKFYGHQCCQSCSHPNL